MKVRCLVVGGVLISTAIAAATDGWHFPGDSPACPIPSAQRQAIQEQQELLHQQQLSEVEAAWQAPVTALPSEKCVSPPTCPPLIRKARPTLEQRLGDLLLPNIQWENAPLEEAVAKLWEAIRAAPPLEKPSINFVVKPEAAHHARPVTAQLANIPARDALQYLADLAGVSVRFEGALVIFLPQTEAGGFAHRAFQVPAGFFQASAAHPSAAPPANPDLKRGDLLVAQPDAPINAREQLEARGVEFRAPATAAYLPDSGILLVYNTAQQLDLVDAMVRAACGRTLMIDITTRIVEISQEDLQEITANWGVNLTPGIAVPGQLDSSGNARAATALRGSQGFNVNGLDQLLGALGSPNPSTLKLQGTIDGNVLNFILSALQQRKSFDLLSAPTVRVKSGEDAKINVGRTFYFPTAYQPPDTVRFVPVARFGTVNVPVKPPAVIPAFPTDFEPRDIGVKLSARPFVGADGKTIDLALAPEVTDLEGFINYGDPVFITSEGRQALISRNEITQPVFNTRRVSTRVLVRDGFTVVLGGLLRDEQQTIHDKVPLLGDIPLVGRAFQSNAVRSSKKNLLIFVTPRIFLNDGNPLCKDGPALTMAASR